MRFGLALQLLLCASGCTKGPPPEPRAPPAPQSSAAAATADKIVTVIGTNDLHGHVEHLDVFAGYVARVRQLRRADGGVMLVDAGDMFQGTLESNLGEGQAVVAAFNALSYTAAALGNHDFDYGPVGEGDAAAGGDPQGAVRARLAQARFPMLSANLIERGSGRAPRWDNLHPAVLVEVAGVKVGIVGVMTAETPEIVLPAHFAGLDVTPLATAIAREAAALRERGARAVVAVAHAGGVCTTHDDPRSEAGCNADQEINRVARELPAGAVDAIIGGHTHQGVAHFFSGTAVAEAFALGRAFSRIDLSVSSDPRAKVSVRIFPPRLVCAGSEEPRCEPGSYEGATIQSDPRVAALVAPWRRAAATRRAEQLGIRVIRAVRGAHGAESALGNWLADLLLTATPKADVAILNGGGLRAPLPAGELTYGQLYECQPFDNRVGKIRLSGAEFRRAIALHLERGRHGIISIAGARVDARCSGGRLDVKLTRANGKVISDAEQVTIATSDYLATGGDELFAGPGRPAPRSDLSTETLRDRLAAELRKRGGSVDGEARGLYHADQPRVRLSKPRPMRCDE